jgi:uncharacterized membrane protein YfcA
MEYIILLIIGLMAGGMSGFFGIGGGIVIVPLLMLFLKYTQQQAQGTSLAVLLPPVGLAAAYQYYKRGDVSLLPAFIVAAGFVIGSLFTAKWVAKVPTPVLKRCFAILLVFYAGQLIAGTAPARAGMFGWFFASLAAFFSGGELRAKQSSVAATKEPDTSEEK